MTVLYGRLGIRLGADGLPAKSTFQQQRCRWGDCAQVEHRICAREERAMARKNKDKNKPGTKPPKGGNGNGSGQ
jgi:hypothetical protein